MKPSLLDSTSADALHAASELTLERVPLGTLKPFPGNPRNHNQKQNKAIQRSIRRFKVMRPILVDEANRILAGHGVYAAATGLGLKIVPVIRRTGLTEAEKHAYVIADNKLAEMSGWDVSLLGDKLELITELDINFDLTLTGLATHEIDLLLGNSEADEVGAGDSAVEPAQSGPCITRPGDLWILGRHRVLCGDATHPRHFVTLMGGARAVLVFVDPPYNLQIDGNVSGLGRVRHREFKMASGEMTKPQYIRFLRGAIRLLVAHSRDGSIHFICIDWRHLEELLSAAGDHYAEFKNLCVWKKSNAGMGTFYRSAHELILVFKNGTAPHVNNFELGQHGRRRTNVWEYAGLNTFRTGRMDELEMHPTVKPVAMVADAIKDCSNRGDIVLDSFAGSGTAILAAEQTGRRAYSMEIDPCYVDIAVRRWQSLTGKDAVHARTRRTFDEMILERSGEAAEDGESENPKKPSNLAHSGRGLS